LITIMMISKRYTGVDDRKIVSTNFW
jgi:hypothetical protein